MRTRHIGLYFVGHPRAYGPNNCKGPTQWLHVGHRGGIFCVDSTKSPLLTEISHYYGGHKWIHHPFLLPLRCILGGMKSFMNYSCTSLTLLWFNESRYIKKVQDQVTFNSHRKATLLLSMSKVKLMTLMIPQEEWSMYSLMQKLQQRPELSFRVPSVWIENIPPKLAQNIPSVILELKPALKVAHQK